MINSNDQAAALREAAETRSHALQSKQALCCIAVASGKGGVGKTFVSTNLALAFAQMGKRTLLVDADLGLASADIVLGIYAEFSIQDALFKGKSLADVVAHTPFGVDLLAASSGAKEMVSLGETRMALFVKDLVLFAAQYDVLIFDCSAGIDSCVTSFIAAAPQTLIVANPQPTSMVDVYALMKIIHQDNLSDNVSLVMNMAESDDQGVKAAESLITVTERFLSKQLRLVGVIPSSPCVPKALHSRKPLLAEFPDDIAALRIRTIARTLYQQHVASGSMFFKPKGMN